MPENYDKSPDSARRFYEQLTAGNSALSLRERLQFSLVDYVQLAERVRAEDKTAFDDFAQKASQSLAIEREIYGSQKGFFDRLDEVKELKLLAMDREDVVSKYGSPKSATGQLNRKKSVGEGRVAPERRSAPPAVSPLFNCGRQRRRNER